MIYSNQLIEHRENNITLTTPHYGALRRLHGCDFLLDHIRYNLVHFLNVG